MDEMLEMQYEDRTYVEDGDCEDIGNDVSEYADEPEPYEETEREDNYSDVEADANTLASAGYGTDEDYEHNLCD
jgi:hypothetical protein